MRHFLCLPFGNVRMLIESGVDLTRRGNARRNDFFAWLQRATRASSLSQSIPRNSPITCSKRPRDRVATLHEGADKTTKVIPSVLSGALGLTCLSIA
jgi:hypothetical protein